MFAKFRLKMVDLKSFLSKYSTDSWVVNTGVKRQQYYDDLLKHAWCDKKIGIIDGQLLKEYVFPTGADGDYDVFISYSHDDEKEAQKLAYYLSIYCKLKVFLDCYVWDCADALLKAIDDDYCQTTDKKHYQYTSRNYSTSHVHALLAMAILDIINKTECCIFLDSDHSINLHNLEQPKQAQTLSPWIFEELSFMRYLPQRSTRKTKYFSKGAYESLNESQCMKMANPVDFSDFEEMTKMDLWKLYEDGNENLDKLYERHCVMHD